MKKLLLTALTLALMIAGATVVLAQTGGGSPSSSPVDVSGPCDEAEHAGDPRCAGGAAQGDRGRVQGDRGRDHAEDDNPSADDLSGEDVSGPCDEAEHANDPECTGVTVAPASDDGVDDASDNSFDDDSSSIDNSGPGSVNSGSDDSFDDDSGSDDDNSGEGGGDDD